MGVACSLGLHSWNGCSCTKCDKTRDEEHDWSRDCEKCSRCGKSRANVHAWDGCKCSKCSKTRNEEHDWSNDCEECARCGHTKTNAHTYDGCKCTACGKIRDEGHDWEGDTCKVCGNDKSAAELWVEGLARQENYLELARLVGKYSFELEEPDRQRREYARLELIAAGETAVDAVAGIIEEEGVNRTDLAEILIASKSRRAALPLLTQFRGMSASPSDVEKMIDFFVEMKAVEVAPGLVTLLGSDYWGTRVLAARALGQLEIAETTEALQKALNGDPHVREGLEQARTQFAQSILIASDIHRRSAGPKVEAMSEADMLKILQSFASAYLLDDNTTRDQLEFTAKDIGEELYRRGDEAAMRKMLQNFEGPASRHIERVWSGIGSWLG